MPDPTLQRQLTDVFVSHLLVELLCLAHPY